MKPKEALQGARQVASMPARLLMSLRQRLLDEQKNLQARMKRLRIEDPFADTSRTNDNAAVDTDANEQVGHERVVGIQSEVDKMLIRVRRALAAIKLGSYGICGNCSQMIDVNRLLINPTAEHCVTCASQLEQLAE